MPPDLKRIEQCRGCGAAIIWASTSTGGKMPVDAEPSADGNILLLSNVDRKWMAIVVGVAEAKARAESGERYRSHFATCPKAGEFRRHHPKAKPKPEFKPAGTCTACGHVHAGREWAFICIGCRCPETPGMGK